MHVNCDYKVNTICETISMHVNCDYKVNTICETISMHVNCDYKVIRYVKPYPCMLTVIIQ